MDRYHSPFPLPDEHMRMLGIIATQWEWVEQLLGNAIAEIMEHKPDRVAILTANVGFHQKCDILKAYARTFQEDDPPRLVQVQPNHYNAKRRLQCPEQIHTREVAIARRQRSERMAVNSPLRTIPRRYRN